MVGMERLVKALDCFAALVNPKGVQKQKKLVALMKDLAKECDGNWPYRGNKKSPFRTEKLAKALACFDFRGQYPEIFKKCQNVDELAYDANNECKRKIDGVPMVPAHAGEEFEIIKQDIDNMLPSLEETTTLKGYWYWRFGRLLKACRECIPIARQQ